MSRFTLRQDELVPKPGYEQHLVAKMAAGYSKGETRFQAKASRFDT